MLITALAAIQQSSSTTIGATNIFCRVYGLVDIPVLVVKAAGHYVLGEYYIVTQWLPAL
jgi:hypothetical protein